MIEPTDEMRRAAYADARIWAERHGHPQPDDRMLDTALAAVLAIVARDLSHRSEGLDLVDVVPSHTDGCVSLQCTGCGWTRHLAPGHVGGRALAHIVDIAQAHARDVDHGGPS